jgi:group I intron endonuclease
METEMSTMKDIIWEENDSIIPPKKSVNEITKNECVTTTTTNDLNGSGHSTDITRTKISGIYKIVNKINGKYYVGSSNIISGRWNGHRHLLNKNIHKNPHLQLSWNKYGERNFDFIIVEEIPRENLIEVEQKYLDVAKTEQHKCYNKSFLADRIEMTSQVIDKIRESNRKRVWSKESLLKLSQIHRGQKHTEETKKLLSKLLKGRKLSEKTKIKIGKSRINLKIFKRYNVKNIESEEIFNGNYYDLVKKLNMSKRSVSNLINGHINLCKNWKIISLQN